MKIDFHTHGKLAKHLPFSPEYTNWLFNEAKNSGLDAICLTEHFNTLGFDEIYRYIENNSEKLGDLFVFNGLKIFPGIEIDIAEGGHTTVIGKMEDIMAIWEEIMPFSENGKFLPLRGLAEKIKKYPVILARRILSGMAQKIHKLIRRILKILILLSLTEKMPFCQGIRKKRFIPLQMISVFRLPQEAIHTRRCSTGAFLMNSEKIFQRQPSFYVC
ncbi:MAG TPA: PHP domain-containing protein [Oscillospiraceae bacterium]|nr:PHP domain-containing protein [Oscillospiraceae bacterium]